MEDFCFYEMCFFKLTGQEAKLFGFAEFLAALALLVLAWTIADFRYRFRIQTAPLPLRRGTFFVVSLVGFLTLATDLWRAEKWYVPRGSVISSGEWQAILGAMFLLTFLVWAWFAFIRPQDFGRLNGVRYLQSLYHTVLKGDEAEIAVVADELAYSMRSIVAAAPLSERREGREKHSPPSKTAQSAYQILLLMGDKRFCKTLVTKSPATIAALFQAMVEQEKYALPIETFARNMINEAILDRNSFIYREDAGYRSGLMGYHKPVTQSIFANFDIIEGAESLLDKDPFRDDKWVAEHWVAYGRLVLMALASFKKSWSVTHHSTVLYRAFGNLSHSCLDLYQVNKFEGSLYGDDRPSRLRAAIETMKKAVEC